MQLFLQQTFNGLALGSAYALFAMSFGLVYATMGVLSVAHGAIATWGALAALYVTNEFGVPTVVSVLIGVLFAAMLSVSVDQIAFQPLRKRNNSLGYIITSIGVWICLISVGETATDNAPQTFPPDYITAGKINISAIYISAPQVWLFIMGLVVLVGMHIAITRTKFGASVRAVGFSAKFSSISGVNSRLVAIWTASIAGATAGLVGVIGGSAFDNVSMALGEGLLLKGFAAVVIGGFGDVRGTYIGGMLIGLTEVLGSQYISSSFKDAISFGLLLVFLVFRPSGIFKEIKFGAAR